MNDYVEVRLDVTPCDETRTDVLAALLAEAGFESFVPDETGITAYIRSEEFSGDAIESIISSFPMECDIKWHDVVVEGQDWNKEWEKNYFQPIVIDDKCVIHSSFHKDIPACTYDIVIDPKMAFGTGHHSTTSLILRQLLSMDLADRNVVDMGTGTGILAILASMRGAGRIDAIEIDEFAYTNACENLKLNGAGMVNIHLGDAAVLETIKDVNLFIANINRNIITADMAAYAATLAPGATMLLSGFYEEDIPVVLASANPHRLTYDSHTTDKNWACLKLRKE
ncbi:MAG: 50S ribosomal protein L11 methyltransferase [Duncaniella sp.]|nr:50S ribosomal protein L11 methyltransferase [Duncaniella sp.]